MDVGDEVPDDGGAEVTDVERFGNVRGTNTGFNSLIKAAGVYKG